MKKFSSVAVCALMLVSLLLLEAPEMMVEAVSCSPLDVTPCLRAVASNTAPSNTCCHTLRAKKACLCSYIRDPSLKKYVNTPGAKTVAAACKIVIPKC